MTRLAQLIAREEGFGKSGAQPTRKHNPGDLRHSPHSEHPAGHPDAIGSIDTDEHGWQDLERQLNIYALRGMTLAEAIEVFAPPNENDTAGYLARIEAGLGMPGSTPLSWALFMPAEEDER
jgi:hypothetical protein